jgi:hypothetical protein
VFRLSYVLILTYLQLKWLQADGEVPDISIFSGFCASHSQWEPFVMACFFHYYCAGDISRGDMYLAHGNVCYV